MAFATSGEILSGDTEGNLMVWRSVKVVRVLKGAHTGPVADIAVMDDGSFVSGGVSDGALVVFDSRLDLFTSHAPIYRDPITHRYDLIGVGAALPEQYGGVRTIVKRDFQTQDGVRKYVYTWLLPFNFFTLPTLSCPLMTFLWLGTTCMWAQLPTP